MRRPFLFGFLLYLAWSTIIWCWRFFWTPLGLITAFLLAAWISFGDSHFIKHHAPYPQKVTVTDAVIRWAHGSSPYVLGRYNVNWIALTMRSTYERPFHPNVLACVIRGPVYHSDAIGYSANGGFISKKEFDADGGEYIGERQLIVKLIPLGRVALHDPVGNLVNWPMPVIAAAERPFLTPWQAPTPVEQEFIYVLTTPRARLLPDDKVTGCNIYEEDKHVDPKIGWIGEIQMPIENLIDTQVDEQAVQAILAAANSGS